MSFLAIPSLPLLSFAQRGVSLPWGNFVFAASSLFPSAWERVDECVRVCPFAFPVVVCSISTRSFLIRYVSGKRSYMIRLTSTVLPNAAFGRADSPLSSAAQPQHLGRMDSERMPGRLVSATHYTRSTERAECFPVHRMQKYPK